MTRIGFALLFVVLTIGLTACGGGDDNEAAPEAPAVTEEAPTATEDGEDGEGDAEAGAEVYASSGCGGCHTFEPAGSTGSVGPNLDDADISFDEAVAQITNGGGGMPAFKDQLTEQQIRDVAAYVSEGGS